MFKLGRRSSKMTNSRNTRNPRAIAAKITSLRATNSRNTHNLRAIAAKQFDSSPSIEPILFIIGKKHKIHGRTRWFKEIKEVQAFVDMVKSSNERDIQFSTCQTLVRELLVTRFGMHVAAELKEKGIRPVLECIDILLSYNSSLIDKIVGKIG